MRQHISLDQNKLFQETPVNRDLALWAGPAMGPPRPSGWLKPSPSRAAHLGAQGWRRKDRKGPVGQHLGFSGSGPGFQGLSNGLGRLPILL